MAAAFAYVAKLPGYVFHSEAGVFGKTPFEETVAIERFGALLRIIPPDVPSWNRFEGKSREAPLRVFADEKIDRYWADEMAALQAAVIGGKTWFSTASTMSSSISGASPVTPKVPLVW